MTRPPGVLARLRCIWGGHDLDDCRWSGRRTDGWHPTVKWCLNRAACAVIGGLNDHDWLPIPTNYQRAA